jgi:hypothetical protein
MINLINHLFGVFCMFMAFTLVILNRNLDGGDSIPLRICEFIVLGILFTFGYWLYSTY